MTPPLTPDEEARESVRRVLAEQPGERRIPEDEHHRSAARADVRGREEEPIASELARAYSEAARAPMDGDTAHGPVMGHPARTSGAMSASAAPRMRPGHVDDGYAERVRATDDAALHAPDVRDTAVPTDRGVRVLPDGTTVHTDDEGQVIVKETARQHTEHELASARARAEALRMMAGDDEGAETMPDDEGAEDEGHGHSRATPADGPATASVGAAMPEDDPGREARARASRVLRGQE